MRAADENFYLLRHYVQNKEFNLLIAMTDVVKLFFKTVLYETLQISCCEFDVLQNVPLIS